MYLTHTKVLFDEATRAAFTDYPIERWRSVWIGTDYPQDKINYPGIWVDFTTTTPLQSAGIGHTEYRTDGGQVRKGTRWRFAGTVSFTIVALTNRERDELADEMIRILAFGGEHPDTSIFRRHMEGNDLIGVNMQWDIFRITGKNEGQGTPWATDEMIYEVTISLDCQGEFVSDLTSQTILVPLSAIILTPEPYGPGFDQVEPTPVTTPDWQ